MEQRKVLKVSEILQDLENGLTRLRKDDFGKGSIQEKYDLSFTEITELFQNPNLANRKTKRVGLGYSFDLIDDINEVRDPAKEVLIKTQEEVQQFISTNIDDDQL